MGALTALFLLLLALVLYLPGFPRGAVLDDNSVFLENPSVRSAGDWLTSTFYTDAYRPIWRPLTQLSLRWNWSQSPGGKAEAGLTQVVLLTVAALLVTALLRRIGVGRPAAVAAAALLITHPVALESVVRMAGRSELLGICLMLAALWLHVSWRREPRSGARGGLARLLSRTWARSALWGLCFLLALLAKEIALMLPALALVVEATVFARENARGRAHRLIGLLIATVVVVGCWGAFREGVLRGWPHEIKRNPAPDLVGALTPPERMRLALGLPAHYGGFIIGAERLLPDYSHLLAWPEDAPPIELGNPHSYGVGLPGWPRVIAGVAILGGLGLLGWSQRRRRPALALGAGWTAVTLLAALPLVRSTGHVASVRDVLLPLAGVAILLGALAHEALARGASPGASAPGAAPQAVRRARILAAVLAVAIIGSSAARTRALMPHWRSQEALMTHLERHAPQSPEVALYHGLHAIRQGNLEEAAKHMEHSAALFARNPRVLLNLGMLYRNQGRTSMAGRALSDAVVVAQQTMPHTAVASQAHVTLGAFLGAQGQDEAALEQYLKGVAADSSNVQALARAGALEALHYRSARDGIRHIRRALALDRGKALGPLADHIRDTAERAERYLRALEGDERSYEENMSAEPGDGATAPE